MANETCIVVKLDDEQMEYIRREFTERNERLGKLLDRIAPMLLEITRDNPAYHNARNMWHEWRELVDERPQKGGE